jgi:hypothetical protein
MKMLSKEQILNANDLPCEFVPVPEWGGDVKVKTMTGLERDAFEVSIFTEDKKKDLRNIRAKLCAYTAVDDSGKLLFSESDIDALGRKSSLALNRVYEVAARLNGIGSKEIEDFEKN